MKPSEQVAMRRGIDDGDEPVLFQEGEPLRIGEKERQRDRHRWELDPASAEDYLDRLRGALGHSERVLRMGHVDRYGRS